MGAWERKGPGRKEGGRGNPGGPARQAGRQAAEGYTAGKGPLGVKAASFGARARERFLDAKLFVDSA